MDEKSFQINQQSWADYFWDFNTIFKNDRLNQKQNFQQLKNDQTSKPNFRNILQQSFQEANQIQSLTTNQHSSEKTFDLEVQSNEELQNKILNSDDFIEEKEEKDSESKQSGGKQEKQSTKQHIYSKKYRQRKKQQMKVLEEQNMFLKRKINDLQIRLRDTENQLNRVKHNLPQQKKSLVEINHIWLKKIKQLLQSQNKDEQALYKQFEEAYNTYGFAGKHKMDKLQYHMNQFIENVLKDSQKYMALTVINDWGLLNETPQKEYSGINYTLFQIMEYDNLKLQTIKKFLGPFLKPSMQKIQNVCRSLYLNFKNVIHQIYTTHEYLKGSRNKDFLTLKQRLQMQNWFQANKYTRQLRQLRVDWIESLKEQNNQCQPKKKRQRKQKIKTEVQINKQTKDK